MYNNGSFIYLQNDFVTYFESVFSASQNKVRCIAVIRYTKGEITDEYSTHKVTVILHLHFYEAYTS